MGLIQKVAGYFSSPEPEKPEEKKEVKTKAEDISRVVAPVWHEIPPEMKTGEYLKELKSWVFIAASAIADEIATSDIFLKEHTADGKKDIPIHPLLSLLERPNLIQTRVEFLWLVNMFLSSEGEAPILLNDANNPTQMLLLNPSRLRVIYKDKEFVGGYKYQRTDGSFLKIKADELILLKLPNLFTPFRGAGTMKYIAKTIDLDNFIEQYLLTFFYNSALPTGVLETEQQLNESILKRLRAQFDKYYRGVKNSHKLAILEKGLTFKSTSFKLNDMMMDKMENKIRDKVLAAFKVPKAILGIHEDINRAAALTADYTFSRRAVRPRLRMIQSQINVFLLPKFIVNENMKFEFEDPVMEDQEMQAKINQIYLQEGVKTVDEVREEIGLDPLKDKDKPKPNPKKPKKPKEDEEKGSELLGEIVKDIFMAGKPKKRKITRKEKEEMHREKILFSDILEGEFKRKLEKYFESLNNRILGGVKKKEIKSERADIEFNEKREIGIMIKIATPFLLEAVEKQSKLAFALMGMEGRLRKQDKIVQEFLEERSKKLGKSTADTTKKNVSRILSDWSETETGIAVLRQKLDSYFGKAQRTRTDAIVRTEISRATGFATQTVYEETGVIGKEWVTAKDERVCEFCRPMDGKIIPINRNFWRKGERMVGEDGGLLKFDFEGVKQFPLHANCRCDLVPVFSKQEIPRKPFGYKDQNKRRLEARDKKRIKEARLKAKEADLKFKEEEITEKEGKLKKGEQKLEKDIKDFKKLNG